MQYKWVALTVTTVGILMGALDERLLIIGLPTITKQLGMNIAEGIWVTQSYQLAETVALLLIGRFADIRGRVKLYNIGFAIFTISSAISATSFSPYQLIFGRAMQGIGASLLSANALAIVTDATPPNELGTFIGFNTVAFRAGSIMGLTFTGLILGIADWRALFYINIPIGTFGTLWAHYRLREISTKDVGKRMDWSGFLTFTTGLALILLAITFSGYGTVDLNLSLGMFAAGLLLIAAFIGIERRSESPLLDLQILKIRAFSLGNLAVMLAFVSWSGMLYMISFFLQLVYGYTPLQAGIGVVPLELTYIFVGPLSGKLSDMYGSRTLATAGLLVTGVSSLFISTFTPDTPYAILAVGISFLGAGQALFAAPNSRSVMASVPSNRRGVAGALRTTFSKVGETSAPGIAVALLTLGIPYSLFTSLINSAGTAAAQQFVSQFMVGFRITTVVQGIVYLLGVIPSALRGAEPIFEKAPQTVQPAKSK